MKGEEMDGWKEKWIEETVFTNWRSTDTTWRRLMGEIGSAIISCVAIIIRDHTMPVNS